MAITIIKQPPFIMPPGYLVVDGSLWDDHVNVEDFIKGGVVSVIMGLYKEYDKYGKVIGLHTNCKRILDQLSKSSLLIMAYYYYWTSDNPEEEADWFLWAMQGYDIRFAWLDAEDYTAIQTKEVRSEMYRRFAARVKSKFDAFGVYTNVAYMIEWAPDMNLWVGKYPAWIPQYSSPQPPGKIVMSWDTLKKNYLPQLNPNYKINVANGQTKVVGHQFTCYPIVPGFYSAYDVGLPTDVNLFDKTFIESLGVPMPQPEICPCCKQVIPTPPDPPVPPVPPDPPAYTLWIVNVNAVNVRSSPSSTPTNWVRYAYKGETLQIIGNLTNGYVQMTDKNWVYEQYLIKV